MFSSIARRCVRSKHQPRRLGPKSLQQTPLAGWFKAVHKYRTGLRLLYIADAKKFYIPQATLAGVSPFMLSSGQDFKKKTTWSIPSPPQQRSQTDIEPDSTQNETLIEPKEQQQRGVELNESNPDSSPKPSVDISTPRTIAGSYINIYGRDLEFYESYLNLNKICTKSNFQKKIFSQPRFTPKTKQTLSFMAKCFAFPGWLWRYFMYQLEQFSLQPFTPVEKESKTTPPINTIFSPLPSLPPNSLSPSRALLSFPTKKTMPYIEPIVDYIDIHDANTIAVVNSKHYSAHSPKLIKFFTTILTVMINFALSGPHATRQEMASRLGVFSVLSIDAQIDQLYDGMLSTSQHIIQPSKMAITIMLKLHESTLKTLLEERIAFYKGSVDAKDENVAQAIMDCCTYFSVVDINDIIMAYHVTAKTIFYDPLSCEKVLAYMEQLKNMKKTKSFSRSQADKEWITQAEATHTQLSMLSVALYIDELKRFIEDSSEQVITAFIKDPFVSWGQYLLTQPATTQRFTLAADPLLDFLSSATEFDMLPMDQAPNIDTFELIKNQIIEFASVLNVPYFEQGLRYLFYPLRSAVDRELETLYLLDPSLIPVAVPKQASGSGSGATVAPVPLPQMEFAVGEAYLDRNTKLDITPLLDCAFAQMAPLFKLLDLDRYTLYQAFFASRFVLILDGYVALNTALGETLAFLRGEAKSRRLTLTNWFELTLKTGLLGLSFTITYLKNQVELYSYDFDQVAELLLRDKYRIDEW